VVREGNPKNIRDFADLAAEGTSVLHTDPTTSGSAQLSILAEYGSAFLRTGDPEEAFAQLLGIWKNVTAQAASARAARTEFGNGTGDALITYEQDAIGTPARRPIAGEIIYPRSTVICEHTAVTLDKNVTDRQRRLVDAFFEFLWSRQAQQIFVDYGFHSPVEELNPADSKLGMVELPFTLQSLGGPRRAQREILDAVWRDRVLPELKSQSGA
jgi:sulfate transport system substrate-binding protein